MGLAKEVIGQREEGWSKQKVCRVLKICKASIYWKPKQKENCLKMKRGYRKKEDAEVLEEVQQVLKERRSYGYRRVTALVNKRRVQRGFQNLNKKRIYRVMKKNDLLLAKSQVRRKEGYKRTGKIITMRSNIRWCSDCFEVQCFNGEKVYVSFILDCHDRECVSYKAEKRPLVKRDIQEVMLSAVEKRFKKSQTPREIQFLTDRGSIYRALETVIFGRYMGLRSCFTAPRSPQSNGMAESFVKTMKRDYVYVSDCDTGESVLKQLKRWILDYNNEAPHSGLGMKSPVEYRESINLGV